MSSKDMRKLMEAYNPTETEAVEETIAPGVPGKKTTFVQKSGIDVGGKKKVREGDDEIEEDLDESDELDESIEEDLDESDEDLDESRVDETGNGNAQQKGINFNGTKAAKGDGVLPRQSPKAKTTGIPKHLSTLGDKKIANESRTLIQELNETYARMLKKGK